MTIANTRQLTLAGRLFPDGRPRQVTVADGRIAEVVASDPVRLPTDVERWLMPGFFDLQVNGFAGASFTEPGVTVEDVKHIARSVLHKGVTRFLPTVVTADLDDMCRQLEVIAETMDGDPLTRAMCPGVHIEGPFIHPADGPRGAHPRQHVRPPGIDAYERLRDACGGRVAMITLAADQPGAVELIRHASAGGAVVALGHHRAERQALDAAIEAGARICTHLGNGTDADLPRHDSYVWWQLGEDRLWASFIADGFHLPPATLKCMLRAKTVARSVLITDAVAAAGMPPGAYEFGGQQVELTPVGQVILPGTPYMAGSAADMPSVIAVAVVHGDVSLVEAVTMASIQPMRLLSGGDPHWSCAVGAQANLVEMDWHANQGCVVIRQVATGEHVVRVNDD